MFLHHLTRAVWAESLKIKRSLALIAALLLPIMPTFVTFAGTLRTGLGKGMGFETSPWSLYFQDAFQLWSIFSLPLIVSILSALLANVDHKPKAWKLLFALPFPRPALFAGKWAALASITLLSTLVFAVTNLLGGLLVHFLHPELGLDLPIPLLEAFARPLLSWLLSLLMISIHLWIALRWSSFLVSVTAGFTASVSNIFLLSSYLIAWSQYSPWAVPIQAYGLWQAPLLVSLAGAALVYLLARLEFTRRDVF